MIVSEAMWKKFSVHNIPSTTSFDGNFWRLIKKGGLVLDVGCGWGRILFQGTEKGFRFFGIDINKESIANLKSLVNEASLSDKITVKHQNVLHSHFKSGHFDAAILQGVLSCLVPKARLECLKKLYFAVKKGGYLHVAEFELDANDETMKKKYEDDYRTTREYGTLSVKDEKGKEIYRTHNFAEKELLDLILKAGFKIVSLRKKFFLSYHGHKKHGMMIIAIKK